MVRNNPTASPTIVRIRTPPTPAGPAYSVPHGFRFNPTSEELLGYFLFNYVQHKFPPEDLRPIGYRDLYQEEPWEAWQRTQIGDGDGDGDGYFFTELKKKQETNKRYERKVGKSGGNWHGEDVGTKFELIGPVTGVWAGTRKRYNYRNNNLPSENGKWILHEYSISKDGKLFDEVLCLLRNNGSPSAQQISAVAVTGKKNRMVDYINDLAGRSSDSPSLKRGRLDDPKGKGKGKAVLVDYETSPSNQLGQFQTSDLPEFAAPPFYNVENVYNASMSESMASTSTAGSHYHQPLDVDANSAIDLSDSAVESNHYNYNYNYNYNIHVHHHHHHNLPDPLSYSHSASDAKRFPDVIHWNPAAVDHHRKGDHIAADGDPAQQQQEPTLPVSSHEDDSEDDGWSDYINDPLMILPGFTSFHASAKS